MNMSQFLPARRAAGLSGSLILVASLTACNDSDSNSPSITEPLEYQVTVTNLTAGQPMSPVALLTHQEGWHAFKTGTAASHALEQLAESGDNQPLLVDAQADPRVYSNQSGSGILMPGQSETMTFSISGDTTGTFHLSLLSMLVNTNDAFAALDSKEISHLASGQSLTLNLITYDAGTEANSETADTLPGPAAEGGQREGYNATRDDVRDAVHVHAGVVTADDGLASSALTGLHRWDHPSLMVTIERL